MAQVVFRFLKPDSFIGRLITWRLKEPWSHVVILIDDVAYSAEVPFVATVPVDFKTVSSKHRECRDIILFCTDEEAAKIKLWCESQVGILYDIASIFGWVFGFNWLQSNKRSYCFEFCRKAMVHMEWLEPCHTLVKGGQLIKELEELVKHQLD